MLLDISWRPSQQGFETTLHDKMPDVVLYREDKKPAGKRQMSKRQLDGILFYQSIEKISFGRKIVRPSTVV